MKAVLVFLITSFIYLAPVQAQQSGKPSPTTSQPAYTLQQQFNALKARSSSHQEFNRAYKVMRVDHLDRLWKQVQDSLQGQKQRVRQAGKATEQALMKARQELKAQQAEIEALKRDNERKEAAIRQTDHDVASLTVFGLDMNKQLYVILSWVVILGLGILAVVLLFLYKKGKMVADEKVKAFEQVSQEFKEHKQTAREREIKIKRELQTEANKVEDLTQQLAQLKRQMSL